MKTKHIGKTQVSGMSRCDPCLYLEKNGASLGTAQIVLTAFPIKIKTFLLTEKHKCLSVEGGREKGHLRLLRLRGWIHMHALIPRVTIVPVYMNPVSYSQCQLNTRNRTASPFPRMCICASVLAFFVLFVWMDITNIAPTTRTDGPSRQTPLEDRGRHVHCIPDKRKSTLPAAPRRD